MSKSKSMMSLSQQLRKNDADKGINKDDVEILKSKENFGFNFQFIDFEKIEVNNLNFYNVAEIEELAEDIKNGGLAHNLVVNRIDEDRYLLISGERRYTAIKLLIEQGFKVGKIPCNVVNKNEIESQIRLIQINALTRNPSEHEKMLQVEQLKILYEAKKQNGEKIEGRIQEKIAETLKMSVSQVNRFNAISQSVEPLKEALKNNEIGPYNASEIARLTPKGQEVALEIIQNSEEQVNIIELKKDIQAIEKEPMTQKSFEKEINKLKEGYMSKAKKEEPNINTAVFKKIKALSNKIDKITCEVSQLNKLDDNLLNIVDKLESSFLGLKEELALIAKNSNDDEVHSEETN